MHDALVSLAQSGTSTLVFIQKFRIFPLDVFFSVFTHFASYVPLYALFVASARTPSPWWPASVCVEGYVLAAWVFLATSALKDVMKLPRPSYPVVWVRNNADFEMEYGCPSVHSAMALAYAVYVYRVSTEEGKPLATHSDTVFYAAVTFVVLISFSRMYLGYHFPLDVALGLIMGYVCTEFYYTYLSELVHTVLLSEGFTQRAQFVALTASIVAVYPHPSFYTSAYADSALIAGLASGLVVSFPRECVGVAPPPYTSFVYVVVLWLYFGGLATVVGDSIVAGIRIQLRTVVPNSWNAKILKEDDGEKFYKFEIPLRYIGGLLSGSSYIFARWLWLRTYPDDNVFPCLL